MKQRDCSLFQFLSLIIPLLFLCSAEGSIVVSPLGKSEAQQVQKNNEQDQYSHFKGFSHNLLLHSDLDEFSVEKGAAISSPFGVGLILANVNEKTWNVSNDGVDKVLQTPRDQVANEYRDMIEKMQKSQMATSNTLFTKDQNVSSSTLSDGSRKLKTETKYVDFIEDWKTTWTTMNGKIANQTNGALDDQLIPKGGWWGGAFYHFTKGAFINTNHYKGSWEAQWNDIGVKKFYDGQSVPYFETSGDLPFIDNEKYTAAAVFLKDGKKSVVFVLPKVPLIPFLKGDMPDLVKGESPRAWKKLVKTIQVPSLNITLLDQHFKKLEALGINYTFCVDEPDSPEIASKKGPYFMGPIVQSHHVRVSPQFFEVATATGSSLNSEEKMHADGNYHTSPLTEEDDEDELNPEAANSQERGEIIVPMELDPKLIRALAEGEMEIKKVDVVVADDKGENDTLTVAASSPVETIMSPPPQNMSPPAMIGYPSSVNGSEAKDNDFAALFPGVEELQLDVTTTPPPPTTPFVPEPLPENTIRFDRPFFWYLFDEEMGPLYYGTIHSLATYQREYGIETDEDLWLYDAYKTLLWNCP